MPFVNSSSASTFACFNYTLVTLMASLARNPRWKFDARAGVIWKA